jgi:uridylate kinase
MKMSGEALVDPDADGPISLIKLDGFANEVRSAVLKDDELQIAIVVGGGNIVRGKDLEQFVGQPYADHMGMLATVINAIALQQALERVGLTCRTMSAIDIPQVAEQYINRRAIHHMENRRVVIFAAGIGSAHFTTDTAAALRAVDVAADVMLLAKYGTDGVYDKDPRAHADARKFEEMTYDEVLSRSLSVMDLTAVTLCKENSVPIYVFDMDEPGAVTSALVGDKGAGTLIQ